jgi:hypothetical protein
VSVSFLRFVFGARGHLIESQGFGYLNVVLSLQTVGSNDSLITTFSGGLYAFLFTISISLSVLTTFILMGLSGSLPGLPASGDN